MWRTILQNSFAKAPVSLSPAPMSHEDVEDLWGLYPIWRPDSENVQISEEEAAELAEPVGLRAIGAELVLSWFNRPEGERNTISAQTEEYTSYQEFQEREIFSAAARSFLANQLPPADVIADSIGRIVTSLAKDPRIRTMSTFRKNKKREIDALIWKAWGVDIKEAHTPIKDIRNREWSRMMYLGRTTPDLAAEFNVSEDRIRKAVERHRERNAELRWLLRAAICHRQNKK